MSLPGSVPDDSDRALRDRVERLETTVANVIERLKVQEHAVNERFEKLGEAMADAIDASASKAERRSGLSVVPVDELRKAGPVAALGPKAGGEPVVPDGSVLTDPVELYEGLEETYEVEKSIWAFSLFIGMPALGTGPSVYMVGLLLVNLLGQGIFVTTLFASSNNFINSSLPKPEDMLRWRTTEGHSLSNVYAGVSLVQRVCSFDSALSVAGTQAQLMKDVHAYTTTEDIILGIPWGVLLTAFVTLLWFLVIAKELNMVGYQVSAFISIPREAETRLSKDGSSTTLQSISVHRLVFVLVVAALRVVVAVTLLISGGMWLAATASLESLVLNAAALGFVMDLDELLMEAFGPERCLALADQLQPLPRPTAGKAFGLGVRPVSLVLAAIVFVVVMMLKQVIPTLKQLESLRDTICGGDTSFALQVHPAFHMLWAARTADIPKEGMESVTTPGANVSRVHRTHIADFIFRNRTESTAWEDHIVFEENLILLEYITAMSPSLLASPGPCEDDEERLSLLLPMIQTIAYSTAQNCSQLAEWCGWLELDIVRTLCSATCQCDSALSGPNMRSGCLPSCESTPRWRSELLATPCVDLSADAVWDHPAGEVLLADFEEDFPDGFDCQHVKPRHCLSPDDSYLGTFLYMCPVSCGCVNASGLFGCPLSCG